jgi:hypothetical protein
MWRTLFLGLLLSGLTTLAQAQDMSWQTCRGVVGPGGPTLTQCRPIEDFVDPQGRELWIQSTINTPSDNRPRAFYVAGVASSEAWFNGRRLGVNGRPGPTAGSEVPGRYQATFPIREAAWRDGGNTLVLHLSSFHGGLRFDRPMSAMAVLPYPYPQRIALQAVTFVAAGALLAAAFGFGVIHAMRRTGSSLVLAAMSGVAALQAIVESLRTLFAYPYPLHAWRMSAIWLLSASFAILLVSYVATRFSAKARGLMLGLALGVVGATALLPGFDVKTVWALILGVALAALPAAAGVRQRVPGARLTLAYLALFLALALGYPEWLADLSYFLLAAGLVLPLLMLEVVRLGRDDRGREAALTPRTEFRRPGRPRSSRAGRWAGCAARRRRSCRRHRRRRRVAFVIAAARRGAGAVAATAQHGQFTAELLQHDLGRILLDARGVGPFAGLDRALDIDRRALAQIAFGHLHQVVVEDHHAVPFGLFLALARGAVAPGFRGGQAQVGDAVARAEGADFGVGPEVADQNDLVDAARHGEDSFSRPATNAPASEADVNGFLKVKSSFVPQMFLWSEEVIPGFAPYAYWAGIAPGTARRPSPVRTSDMNRAPFVGVAQIDAFLLHEDELALVGAGHFAAGAAQAHEAQAHAFQLGRAELEAGTFWATGLNFSVPSFCSTTCMQTPVSNGALVCFSQPVRPTAAVAAMSERATTGRRMVFSSL